MTLFWILSAAMMLVAAALLVPQILRPRRPVAIETEKLNVQIARDHLADLVRQRDAGELSDEEFRQGKRDLELALAQDLEGAPAAALVDDATSSGRGRWALVVSALLVPLITVPLYFRLGSPELIVQPPGSPAVIAGHGEAGELPPIEELVKQLRARMEANPSNAEGWFLLGRTYMRLEDYPQAVYAFEKLVELIPDQAVALLALADALTMRDGRPIGERAVGLLQSALELDPESSTALWLLGSAAMDHGDNAAAIEYWQRAYPLLAEEPAMQFELGRMIREAGGETPEQAAAAAPAAPAVATPAPGPAPAAGSEPAPAGEGIVVEVALAPPLLEQLAPSDTVFVLARAVEGPPMPLAVARLSAEDLPLRVTLTDGMAMMAGMQLSAFDQVRVSARVSKSGQAGLQAGDLYAEDVVVSSGSTPGSAQLLIDRVVE
jgi:cytochrome c-type biogenesis protein CcmH